MIANPARSALGANAQLALFDRLERLGISTIEHPARHLHHSDRSQSTNIRVSLVSPRRRSPSRRR